MDLFIEEMVKHKRSGKDMLITAAIVVAAIVLIALSTLVMSLPFIGSLWLFIVAGIIYGAYILIRSFNAEYEYILTNSDLDIDKIVAKKTRKRVAELNFKDIEICAPIKANDTNEGFDKVIDCTGTCTGTVYKIDIVTDSKKTRIIFEPSRELIESAKRFNPSKITVE